MLMNNGPMCGALLSLPVFALAVRVIKHRLLQSFATPDQSRYYKSRACRSQHQKFF